MPAYSKENAFLVAALAATHAGAFECCVPERMVTISANLEALLGFPPGGFDGRMDSLLEILNPHDRERIINQVRNAPPDQTHIETEFRVIEAEGQGKWFSIHGELKRNASGEVVALLGMAQEVPSAAVTERRMRSQQATLFELLTEERIDTLPVEDALKRITERAAQTLGVERVSVWRFSPDQQQLNCQTMYRKGGTRQGQCDTLNAKDFPGYFDALSQSRCLAVSYAPTDYRTRELADAYLKPLGITSMLDATIRRKGETIGVVCHEQVGPPRIWTLDEQRFASCVTDLVTLMLESSERERLLAKVEHQATHDQLTSLPNRFWFRTRLEQRIRQSDAPFALILADLDQFKEINDTLGHEPGDEMLTELGHRLAALLPPGGALARLGGDEFGVLLENSGNPGQLTELAEGIRQALHQPVTCQGMRLAVTASLGASLYPRHGTDASTLMRCADVALYSAKSDSGFRIYDPARDRHTPRRLTLMHDLITAVEKGDLWAVYQPKMDLAGKEVTGLEVLARWTHPLFGEILPEEFIPLAELSDLIQPLTLHMIELTCTQWRIWKNQGRDLHLAVNLSPRMLMTSGWMEALLDTLARVDMPPDRLELEVTEGAFIHEPELALATMQALSGKGIRFSLDDFGMGYSSLTHLSRMPIHTLKIDKSFIQKMCHDERLLAIVRSTVQLGDNLGIDVIAEGVESAQQFEQLRLLKCHQVQGFHLSHPLQTEDVPGFFASL
ncbi:MAG TPA: EAL domain-containing protein [Thiobacillaceae bacterium]|nr:EAL domain-containing protein [Thiobacillaceae bacterium]